jgi:hypothetical protein
VGGAGDGVHVRHRELVIRVQNIGVADATVTVSY